MWGSRKGRKVKYWLAVRTKRGKRWRSLPYAYQQVRPILPSRLSTMILSRSRLILFRGGGLFYRQFRRTRFGQDPRTLRLLLRPRRPSQPGNDLRSPVSCPSAIFLSTYTYAGLCGFLVFLAGVGNGGGNGNGNGNGYEVVIGHCKMACKIIGTQK